MNEVYDPTVQTPGAANSSFWIDVVSPSSLSDSITLVLWTTLHTIEVTVCALDLRAGLTPVAPAYNLI
jgi:hypothetical protein